MKKIDEQKRKRFFKPKSEETQNPLPKSENPYPHINVWQGFGNNSQNQYPLKKEAFPQDEGMSTFGGGSMLC